MAQPESLDSTASGDRVCGVKNTGFKGREKRVNVMNCTDVKENLSIYMDGEQGDFPIDEVAKHIEGCASCRGELDGLTQVRLALRKLSGVPVPASFDEEFRKNLSEETAAAKIRSRRKTFRMISSIAAVFVIVFFSVLLINDRVDNAACEGPLPCFGEVAPVMEFNADTSEYENYIVHEDNMQIQGRREGGAVPFEIIIDGEASAFAIPPAPESTRPWDENEQALSRINGYFELIKETLLRENPDGDAEFRVVRHRFDAEGLNGVVYAEAVMGQWHRFVIVDGEIEGRYSAMEAE